MSKLNNIVKALCKFSGKKMKEVAEDMGISPVTLSQNLAKDKPRASTFERLAHAFTISVEDFKRLYDNPDGYELTHMIDEDTGMEKVAVVPKEQNFSLMIDSDDVSLTNKAHGASSYSNKVAHKMHTVKQLPSASENETIPTHAEFIYEGNTLIADTFLDATLLINNLSALEQRRTTDGKDSIYQSMLSVLVKQYGNKKEG